jgi:subtilase family serine protease
MRNLYVISALLIPQQRMTFTRQSTVKLKFASQQGMGELYMRNFRYLRHQITIVVLCITLLSLVCSVLYFHSGVAHAAASTRLNTVRAPAVYVNEGETAAGKPTGIRFKCQASNAPVRCYSPQQIRRAYNVQSVLDAGITGEGRTIVIIDAFQSPTIVHDLATFDGVFGLPNPTLNIIAPDGLTPFNPNDPNQVGWAGEITLDVEWSHVVAPDATIDLVLAKSSNDPDILSVTKYAVENNLGGVISQSFGEGETCADPNLVQAEHQVFKEATAKHITLFASSGDQGAALPTCNGSSFFLSASTPASDPFVTGVGGTHLEANSQTGAYAGETAWNDSFGASGGGFSTVYSRPNFQEDVVQRKHRGVPDVAYNGDVNGGVLVVWSSSGAGPNKVFIFGGTSAGSPQWAGIIALGNQVAGHRLGFINKAIYRIGESAAYSRAFHDIVIGNNTFTVTDASGNTVTILGYNTRRGWDPVTGWGSPNVARLLPLLIDNDNAADGASIA